MEQWLLLGAAMLAAVGHGAHSSIDEAARVMVRTAPVDARPDLSDAYDARYAQWRELEGKLRTQSVE